jgi:imidazolonepropionase-like amidohydrolase
MFHFNAYIIFILIATFFSAEPQNYPDPKDLNGDFAITNVSVLDMNTGQMVEDNTVLVSKGLIVEIKSSPEVPIPADFKNIDGTGKFLIPGLSEMHAHIPIGPVTDDLVKETLFLYLSQGVTTIRGMMGHPLHLELKEAIEADEIISPRVYAASPGFNGNNTQTKEEASIKVRQFKEDGYDLLKIYPGLKREVFDEIVATANSVGIPFAGHVPEEVGIDHAIVSKYASIDHLDGYVDGITPKEQRDLMESGGFFGILYAPIAEEEKIPDLVRRTKEAGVAIVPTQTLTTRWLAPKPSGEMINEPEMRYMSASTRYSWRQQKERLINDLSYERETYDRFIYLRNKFIKEMHDQGVLLLLGSDAPQVLNVPGFSLHHEILTYRSAGLSAFEILQTGTVNVAQYFGKEDLFGKIEKGLAADLVLLAENPLSDLDNVSKIEGVMYRGHWLSGETIEKILHQIAENNKD